MCLFEKMTATSTASQLRIKYALCTVHKLQRKHEKMRKKVLGLLRRKRGGLKKRFMFDENGNKLLFLTPRNFQGAELYYFCSLLKMYAFIM